MHSQNPKLKHIVKRFKHVKYSKKKKTSYPIVQRLFAMRRYGGWMLYAALPLHMQRGCFRIRYAKVWGWDVVRSLTFAYAKRLFPDSNP